MVGHLTLTCPDCGRVFGKPVEMTVIKEDLNVTYAPICIECPCGATWSSANGGRATRARSD